MKAKVRAADDRDQRRKPPNRATFRLSIAKDRIKADIQGCFRHFHTPESFMNQELSSHASRLIASVLKLQAGPTKIIQGCWPAAAALSVRRRRWLLARRG